MCVLVEAKVNDREDLEAFGEALLSGLGEVAHHHRQMAGSLVRVLEVAVTPVW